MFANIKNLLQKYYIEQIIYYNVDYVEDNKWYKYPNYDIIEQGIDFVLSNGETIGCTWDNNHFVNLKKGSISKLLHSYDSYNVTYKWTKILGEDFGYVKKLSTIYVDNMQSLYGIKLEFEKKMNIVISTISQREYGNENSWCVGMDSITIFYNIDYWNSILSILNLNKRIIYEDN